MIISLRVGCTLRLQRVQRRLHIKQDHIRTRTVQGAQYKLGHQQPNKEREAGLSPSLLHASLLSKPQASAPGACILQLRSRPPLKPIQMSHQHLLPRPNQLNSNKHTETGPTEQPS